MGDLLEPRDVSKYTDTYSKVVDYYLHRIKGGPAAAVKIARFGAEFPFLPHYWTIYPSWRISRRRRQMDRVLPDFVCLGTIKGGTSSMATDFFRHPSIAVPLTKEIFDENPEQWRPHYPRQAEMDEIKAETGHAITGYFAPRLQYLPLARTFHKVNPNGKAILLVRDPVKRMYSHFCWEHLIAGQWIKQFEYYNDYGQTVDYALKAFPNSLAAPSGYPLLQSGIYDSVVREWLEVFGPDNVLVLSAEEYFADTHGVMGRAYDFLGIPGLKAIAHANVNENPLVCPPEDPAARARLVEFYRPWNEKLFELLGRDFGWT